MPDPYFIRVDFVIARRRSVGLAVRTPFDWRHWSFDFRAYRHCDSVLELSVGGGHFDTGLDWLASIVGFLPAAVAYKQDVATSLAP